MNANDQAVEIAKVLIAKCKEKSLDLPKNLDEFDAYEPIKPPLMAEIYNFCSKNGVEEYGLIEVLRSLSREIFKDAQTLKIREELKDKDIEGIRQYIWKHENFLGLNCNLAKTAREVLHERLGVAAKIKDEVRLTLMTELLPEWDKMIRDDRESKINQLILNDIYKRANDAVKAAGF